MAKYKLGEIYGELKLKSTEWSSKLSKSKEGLKDFGLAAAKAFAVITATVTALTAALTKITKDTVRYGVEIDKWGKVLDLTGEKVSRLKYAIDQEHGSFEQLGKGLFNLNIRLGYAGDGLVTYTRYFKALGIEYKNNEGTLRNSYDVFLDLVDIMNRGTISTETMAAASQLLGSRAAKDLIPFMKLGREEIERLGDEAEALGLVMSTETAAGMKKVDDAITAMKGSLKGFRNLIGERIAPAVKGFTETMVNAFIQIRENIDKLLPSLANLGSDTDQMAQVGVNFAKKTMTAIFAVMNGWQRLQVVIWTVAGAMGQALDLTVGTVARLGLGISKVYLGIENVSRRIRGEPPIITNANIEQLERLSTSYNDWSIMADGKVKVAMDNLWTGWKAQEEILNNLEPMVLHFSDVNKELPDDIEKTAEAVGEMNTSLENLQIAVPKVSEEMRGWVGSLEEVDAVIAKPKGVKDNLQLINMAASQFGAVMGDVFGKAKMGADDFLKSLVKIGLQLLGMAIGGPAGGFLGGLLGGLFGEGGVAIPRGTAPVFAAEGMVVANKPTMSPAGNVFAENGSEVFMKGNQFTEFLKSMRPTVIINEPGPSTWVQIIENASQGDLQRLGRVILDSGLKTQEELG